MSYKIVSIEALANFIAELPYFDEYSFAVEWPEEQTEIAEWEAENWFGIKKVGVFDNEVVLIGNYGGGRVVAMEVDDCLEDSLEEYIRDYAEGSTIEGYVVLDTERVK